MYADGRYAVLRFFLAMDAVGKDGTIRHVFSGVNPLGLNVINATSRTWTPWHAIPAGDKHHAGVQVANLVNEALEPLGQHLPAPDPAAAVMLKNCAARLLAS
jgi:polyphosphate kinase 2 (PPK2 family)